MHSNTFTMNYGCNLSGQKSPKKIYQLPWTAASQYGYTFALHSKGKHKDASFYARSSKMKLVTLSSTEAEYVAAAEVTSEVLFLRTLLADIGFPQDKPTKIYEDNKSCIHMLYGTGHHQRTKHINGKYHFSKQQIKQKTIKNRSEK